MYAKPRDRNLGWSLAINQLCELSDQNRLLWVPVSLRRKEGTESRPNLHFTYSEQRDWVPAEWPHLTTIITRMCWGGSQGSLSAASPQVPRVKDGDRRCYANCQGREATNSLASCATMDHRTGKWAWKDCEAKRPGNPLLIVSPRNASDASLRTPLQHGQPKQALNTDTNWCAKETTQGL